MGKPVHSEDFGSKRYRVAGCPHCGGTYDSSELYCFDCKQKFNPLDLKSWAKFLHGLQRACKRWGLGVHPLGQSLLPFDIPQLSSDRRAFLSGERELSEVTHPDYIRRHILRQSGWSPDLDLSLIAQDFSHALKEVLQQEKKQPQYVFRYEPQSKKWSIVWRGQKIAISKDYVGLPLIRHLLGSPGQPIPALSLESLCGNRTAGQGIDEVTTEVEQLLGDCWVVVTQFGQDDFIAPRDILQKLETYRSQLEEELVADPGPERSMDLSAELEGLHRYIETATRPGGRLKKFQSELDRSASRVSRNRQRNNFSVISGPVVGQEPPLFGSSGPESTGP